VSGRVATRIAAIAGAAVVVGAVVFLSMQTLEQADNWSSVGAFLASLITVVVSAVAWVSTRSDPNADPTGPPRRTWRVLNILNGNVINGDNTRSYLAGNGSPVVFTDAGQHGDATSAEPEAPPDGGDRSGRTPARTGKRRSAPRRRSR
jgi:hypothetical protein